MYLISISQQALKKLRKSKILAGLLALIMVVIISAPTISQTTENYGEALQKAILFYEAQQTGRLPEWNRVPWRGDATLEDGADVGVDLSGGWVDAGDNVKFNFPLAFSVTTLAWGGIEYYDAYKKSGQLVHLSQNLKWVTDYFLNAFANDTPGEYVLYGQVGNGELDHQWWGSVEVVNYQMERPAFKIDTSCPGTDLAGETSAAMASSSILFRKNGDTEYADLLVDKAEKLFDFANKYRGKYSDCLKEAVPFYTSNNGYLDELIWGAIWLHKAKKAQNSSYSAEYLAIAETEYQQMGKPFNYTYQFDDKSYGIYVLLAQETGKIEYQQRTEAWLNFWTIGHEGEQIKYTPGGLAFLAKWGSLPLAANTSFLAFIYSDWLQTQGKSQKAEGYFDFGVNQINYILGQNPAKRSYLIGYGDNYPHNPHHRTAHGSWLNSMNEPTETRNLLIGALVGGPDEQEHWADDRNDWVRNEVGVSYNAGFAGALAKMYQEFGGKPLTKVSFPQLDDEPEIYVESRVSQASKNATEINLSIVNKSAAPAQGWEDPLMRVFYTAGSNKVEDIAASATSNDCSIDSATVVKLKKGLYYTEIACGGTVIYPGGNEKYMKQISLKLNTDRATDNNFFGSLSSLFAKPLQITKICLYDGDELIWESDSAI
ncbi:glycoside hydrolase family 9 protein [Pleurocapsa sp. FMAR1]|uniref:glycoside hydrolase family 9 protein n=1 Tax=Pleurocapsa sp. FMAR1 TaxID=3040204 RepID=UPI0029C71FB8|nr:glycoside hydrolase family 9 protein [Pleurocapsa sp. FMAR1]